MTFDFLKMHIDIELYGTSSSIYIPLKLFEKNLVLRAPGCVHYSGPVLFI